MLMNAVGALIILGSYLLIGITVFVSKSANPLWTIFLLAGLISIFRWNTKKKHKTSLIVSLIVNVILGFSLIIGTIIYCESSSAIWSTIPLGIAIAIHNEKID